MKASIEILMAAALALGGELAATEATACGNGKVIFEDKFETLDPSWGNASNRKNVENGALVLKPESGRSVWAISESDYYSDAAICVDATVTNGTPEFAYHSIVFWFQDSSNFYELGVWPNGKIDVERWRNGKILYPVSNTEVPALKKGLGQTNSLEVETKGNMATVYVNGTKIVEFKGTPPEGGGKVGLDSVSPQTGDRTVVRFTNFVVAEPR
jgi:Domain of Unknown Function (DUF1080)